MSLTAAQSRQLVETEAKICQLEQILAVTSGLGSSHSSQGVSASFSDYQIKMAASQLPVLRNVRARLVAIRDGTPLPPAPGVTVTRYIPTVPSYYYGPVS